jgi:LysM repeat protein
MYNTTTKTERNLRDGTNTKAKVIQTLKGDHTLTGDALWTASMALPAANQQVGDEWLHITAVDGVPVTSRYLAIKDNGTVYGTLTQLPGTVTSPRTHKVTGTDNLFRLSKTYATTVDKIVAANKLKYPTITPSYIQKDWELVV